MERGKKLAVAVQKSGEMHMIVGAILRALILCVQVPGHPRQLIFLRKLLPLDLFCCTVFLQPLSHLMTILWILVSLVAYSYPAFSFILSLNSQVEMLALL